MSSPKQEARTMKYGDTSVTLGSESYKPRVAGTGRSMKYLGTEINLDPKDDAPADQQQRAVVGLSEPMSATPESRLFRALAAKQSGNKIGPEASIRPTSGGGGYPYRVGQSTGTGATSAAKKPPARPPLQYLDVSKPPVPAAPTPQSGAFAQRLLAAGLIGPVLRSVWTAASSVGIVPPPPPPVIAPPDPAKDPVLASQLAAEMGVGKPLQPIVTPPKKDDDQMAVTGGGIQAGVGGGGSQQGKGQQHQRPRKDIPVPTEEERKRASAAYKPAPPPSQHKFEG